MGNSSYDYQIRFGPTFTPLVKILVITNAIIFLLQFIFGALKAPFLEAVFALQPDMVSHFHIYQLLTYSFLHADFLHLVYNMLALWMFGSDIESYWGRNHFGILYFFSAFTGGLLVWLAHLAGFNVGSLILGASGGIFGIMITYALLWPNREVLVMFIFPLKIKYLVFLILLPMTILYQQPGISNTCHLGGAIGGFLFYYAYVKRQMRFDFNFSLDRFLQRRKMRRYQEEMQTRMNVKDRVDELLEKISKKGMKSLTKKEREFLKEASSKYYAD